MKRAGEEGPAAVRGGAQRRAEVRAVSPRLSLAQTRGKETHPETHPGGEKERARHLDSA